MDIFEGGKERMPDYVIHGNLATEAADHKLEVIRSI